MCVLVKIVISDILQSCCKLLMHFTAPNGTFGVMTNLKVCHVLIIHLLDHDRRNYRTMKIRGWVRIVEQAAPSMAMHQT